MIELIDFLDQHLPVDRNTVSWAMLVILLIWSFASTAKRVGQTEKIKALTERNADIREHFEGRTETLEGAIGEVIYKLSELTDKLEEVSGMTIHDRQNQAGRVKIEITRSFPGDLSAGAKSYVFAAIHNTSPDPIYDCIVDVLIRGERGASQRVGWLVGRSSRRLRFTSEAPFSSIDEVDFSATFRDYSSRSWRLASGSDPEQIQSDGSPSAWVYREPQTDLETE